MKHRKLMISLKVVNSEYDKDYAKQYNGGEESENNQKYRWETKLESDFPVKERVVTENETRKYGDFEVDNLVVLTCKGEESKDEVEFVVSKELLESHFAAKHRNGKPYYYFFLKDELGFVNLKSGVFLWDDKLPKNYTSQTY